MAKGCPLLKKFNNKRTTQRFSPICLETSRIVVDVSKEPVSMEEVAKQLAQVAVDLEEKLTKMDRHLKSLEKSPALKQKRDIEDPDPNLLHSAN